LALSVIIMICIVSSKKAHAGGSITLQPPFSGTYRMTSYFDHTSPNYVLDNNVTIYNGESVLPCTPYCYAGHSGADWSMPLGTPVLASADGIVEDITSSSTGYGNRIILRHANSYRTLYGHLNSFTNINIGDNISGGSVIGYSGNSGNSSGPHLHFGVYRSIFTIDEQNVTDPFGWTANTPDPLLNYPYQGSGHIASCLWRSKNVDPFGCRDIIVEDDGSGWFAAGAWLTSNLGNGYHMYYRTTVTDVSNQANWQANAAPAGMYQVSAYIPAQHGTATSVPYWISTAGGWQQVQLNQQIYSDQWVTLGSYQFLPGYVKVVMHPQSSEPPGTREVAADSMRFRSFRTYISAVLNAYCAGSYGQLLGNSNFDLGNQVWYTNRTVGANTIIQILVEPSNYAAELGVYDNQQDYLSQTACVPQSLSSAILTFSWYIQSAEGTGTPYDYLYVYIRDTYGNILSTARTLSNTSIRDNWVTESYDLSAFAGQTIRISFEARTDSTQVTNFWIENTNFNVNP